MGNPARRKNPSGKAKFYRISLQEYWLESERPCLMIKKENDGYTSTDCSSSGESQIRPGQLYCTYRSRLFCLPYSLEKNPKYTPTEEVRLLAEANHILYESSPKGYDGCWYNGVFLTLHASKMWPVIEERRRLTIHVAHHLEPRDVWVVLFNEQVGFITPYMIIQDCYCISR